MPRRHKPTKPSSQNQHSLTPHDNRIRVIRAEKNLTGEQRLARALLALAKQQKQHRLSIKALYDFG